VPTHTEFIFLVDYLGGEAVAGGKMKSTGTQYWGSPNIGATNESGFSALPSGDRCTGDGSFTDIFSVGRWWSSTEYGLGLIYQCVIQYNFSDAFVGDTGSAIGCGLSVRCVKD
jgi:uncharacterized protein (TIGR02145 family)